MSADLRLINISGTSGGFTGSHTASVTILVGLSGNTYIPIRVDDTGAILTSGLN